MTTPETPAAQPFPHPTHPDGRDFLIRSEEQLHVVSERVPRSWARLEKYLVTEMRTFTVEVTHEEFRMVTGPVDPGRMPAPADGKNAARWMYLSQEEVVVTKRVVPVERVRLDVYPVVEQRQFTGTVRKERIDGEPVITPVESGPAAHDQQR